MAVQASATSTDAGLDVEQRPFALHAAGVSAQGPVTVQHPVTRDHDRQGVRSERVAGGPRGPWASGHSRETSVARHRAIRDLRGRPQHAPSKAAGEPPVERKLELSPLTTEILVELAARPLEREPNQQHPW